MNKWILTSIVASVLIISAILLSGQFIPTGAAVQEQLSSTNFIDLETITVYESHIELALTNVTVTKFANTNSMDPTFDVGAHGLEVPPKQEDLSVGDIISYKSPTDPAVIVHRIIDIGEDEQGIYYTLQGDNNPTPDPHRVRFEWIQGVMVGILY